MKNINLVLLNSLQSYIRNIEHYLIKRQKKNILQECFKEYVGGHQEKVKPFHSYMKTITQKIRQKINELCKSVTYE